MAGLPLMTPERMTTSPTAVVCAAVEQLQARFFEPLSAAELFRDAWQGAAVALARAGVSQVPLPPTYPAHPAAACALHADTFPALEHLATGRLPPDALTRAALGELAARRRDGHTCLLTPRMLERWQWATDPSGDLGLVLSEGAHLTLADLRPGGAAQRAGLRRGERLLAINGQPCAGLRRVEAQALLDYRVGATNEFDVQDDDGRRATLAVRGDASPRISARILPGPFGLLRADGFAGTDEDTAAFGAAFADFEAAGARGWIVDVRWCGGGVSIGLSRLLVARGRLFSRVRHNEARLPDGTIPIREDIDADGSALRFQRPLVVLIGPGSVSGAESLAGPLQALGRATLVGERTAGLCGTGPVCDIAPGWRMTITTRQTLFGPQQRAFNRIGAPPDVVVVPTRADEAAGRDPQLEAALTVLGGQDLPRWT